MGCPHKTKLLILFFLPIACLGTKHTFALGGAGNLMPAVCCEGRDSVRRACCLDIGFRHMPSVPVVGIRCITSSWGNRLTLISYFYCLITL